MVATYATVPELKDRLHVEDSDRDYAFGHCLDAASRWIDNQTRRRFYTATETRYYTAHWHYPHRSSTMAGDYPWGNPERPYGGGRSGQTVAIDDFLSVSAVVTDSDGDGVYETTWTNGTDYWLGPRNALTDGLPYRAIHRNQVTGRYSFPPYDNAISVTGSAGYSATVPDAIRELCLMVAELMARPVLDLTIAGVATYKFGDQMQVTMDSKDISPLARQILQEYRDPVFL